MFEPGSLTTEEEGWNVWVRTRSGGSRSGDCLPDIAEDGSES